MNPANYYDDHSDSFVSSEMPEIRTEDGKVVNEGDRVFNYYDWKWGSIERDSLDKEGWFRIRHDDGTTAILNGARIATYQPRR